MRCSARGLTRVNDRPAVEFADHELVRRNRAPSHRCSPSRSGIRSQQTPADDIPLGAHGSYFDLDAKYQNASKGDATAFIDPDGYKKNVASAEKDFLTELAKQKALQAR
jgi:hypothetical protein